MLDTVYRKVANRINDFFIDGNTKKLIDFNKKNFNCKQGVSSKILVDNYNIQELHIAYSFFLYVLTKKFNSSVFYFEAQNKTPRRVKKIYKSIGVTKVKLKRISKKCFSKGVKKFSSKKELLDFSICEIPIGIDIYESYLARYKVPTVDLSDDRLYDMIGEATSKIKMWTEYFEKNSVSAVVLSHDIYLEMNLLAKVAYKYNTPVYLPNVRGMYRVGEHFDLYKYLISLPGYFRKLSEIDQKNALYLAKSRLDLRFSGATGIDMSYVEKSAFGEISNKRVTRESSNTKVLICSHCFYDNPHTFHRLMFEDFYEWLKFLVEVADKTDYDWYLKVHPDPLPGTLETIDEIVKDSKIEVIPYDTSHKQLVKEGIEYVLTGYGSVGHEYPLMGVQVINAAYNPHIAYDFNFHPESVDEYKKLLLSLNEKPKKPLNPEKVYEFYYMHYYYTSFDDFIFTSYRKYLDDLTPKERSSSKVYDYFLKHHTPEKHKEILDNISRFVDSGKKYWFDVLR